MSQAREDAKIFYEKEDIDLEIKSMLSQISSNPGESFSLMSNPLVKKTLFMLTFLHILSCLVGSSYVSHKKSVSACYFVFVVYSNLLKRTRVCIVFTNFILLNYLLE